MRKRFRDERLPAPALAFASESAAATLAEWLSRHVAPGSVVALFAALPGELVPDAARTTLGDRFRWALPRVVGAGRALTFHLPDGRPLEASHFGVMEPAAGTPAIVPAVVVVPGLAFDRDGFRLGHGAGYYDRTLAELGNTVKTVGFIHRPRVVDRLPRASWDVPVQHLVTDTGAALVCGG